jgi:hypothetical protein
MAMVAQTNTTRAVAGRDIRRRFTPQTYPMGASNDRARPDRVPMGLPAFPDSEVGAVEARP